MKKTFSVLMVLLILVGCSTNSTESNQQAVISNDVKEESKDISAKGNEIALEDIYARKEDTFWNLYIKIRNNYGTDVYHIEVNYKLLDKNGDTLNDYGKAMAVEFEDGEAKNVEFQVNKGNVPDFDNIEKIKFTSFEIWQQKSDGSVYTVCEGKLSTPVEYNWSEIESR